MDQQIILSSHPWLSRLFRGTDAQIFGRLLVPGFVLLCFASFLRITTLAGTTQRGASAHFGYLWAWNWSVMYIIVLPAIFLGFVVLSRHIARSIADLESNGVLACSGTKTGTTAADAIKEYLEKHSKGLVVVATLLAFGTVYGDTLDIAGGYYFYGKKTPPSAYAASTAKGCLYKFAEEDWAVAFAPWCKNKLTVDAGAPPRPTLSQNLVFDIAAFLLEGCAIFLGFFWAGKIWQFLYCFSSLLENPESGVDFKPNTADIHKRFGLYPLGMVYDFFLGLVLIFEAYVVGLRLKLITARPGFAVSTYLSYLAEHFKSPSYWLRADFYHWDAVSPGMWMLILGISLPAVTICWLPLYKLRLYLIRVKIDMATEYRLKKEQAKNASDDALYKEFSERLTRINGYSVWPNGDTIGKILLLSALALWLSALAPPVFVTVLLAVGLPLLGRAIGKGKTANGGGHE